MTAPHVSITPAGTEPATDLTRLIERAKRLKYAIAKPTTNDSTVARLQTELDKIQPKLEAIKAAVESV